MSSDDTGEMDRRTFVKKMAASLAAPTLGSVGVVSRHAKVEDAVSRQSKSRSPNVIILICDDLGYGDLHCYGSSLKTPNLDRMAAEGARFTRFNSAHPICSASRAALLTGRYANRSHVVGAYAPFNTDGMDLDEKTLADILKGVGYKSMCIGKWHLGRPTPYLPTSRGFDAFFGVPWSVDMKPLPLIRDVTVIEENADRDLLTPLYTAEAVRFIDSSTAADPFFLYLAHSYPHDPPLASPRFRGNSKLGPQGDSIEEIDWSVGEILAAVRRNGLDRDTIIIFTSDHGPWFQGSPGALRGRKETTFEGGVRIPFIVRWTGTIPAGRTIDEWGSNLDVVPTLASICGASPPEKELDGVDISQLLTGEKTGVDRGTVLYFAMDDEQRYLECARKQNWKLRIAQRDGEIYIGDWYTGHKHFLLARPELYNLECDPAESYDAALDHADIVREIQEDVEALIPSFPDDVVKAYADLKTCPDSPSTPPGAAPRPTDFIPQAWRWVPRSRQRDH